MDDPSTVPTRKRARGKKDVSTSAAAAAGARKRSAFAARNLISKETARHQGATKILSEEDVVVVEDEDEGEDDVEEVEIGAERKGKEGEEEDLEGEEEEEDHQVVVSQGPPAKRRRSGDGWDEDENAVLWVARVHASGKSHLETVNLGRECSFQNLQRTVAATRRNLNLVRHFTLSLRVDASLVCVPRAQAAACAHNERLPSTAREHGAGGYVGRAAYRGDVEQDVIASRNPA
jgi:hypothetical protein